MAPGVLRRWLAGAALCLLWGCPPAQGVNAGEQRVVTDIPSQDGVCSVWGLRLNEQRCTMACCDAHDRCYATTGCRAASWLVGPAAPTCHACNQALLDCLAEACAEDDEGTASAQDTPEGTPCVTSLGCASGQLCSDLDCDGAGTCTGSRSGPEGACCTVHDECASGLCLADRCARPRP